jgi:hypothetical protein
LPLPGLVKFPQKAVAECQEARLVPGAAVERQVAVTIRHLVRVSDLRGQTRSFVLVLRKRRGRNFKNTVEFWVNRNFMR